MLDIPHSRWAFGDRWTLTRDGEGWCSAALLPEADLFTYGTFPDTLYGFYKFVRNFSCHFAEETFFPQRSYGFDVLEDTVDRALGPGFFEIFIRASNY